MKREERERLVDGALARALAPKQIEPRQGFEKRLLAGIAAQPERRAWWRWVWVPTLAAAAVLAIVTGMRLTRRPVPVIDTHRTTAPAEQPVVTARVPVEPAHAPVVRKKHVRRVQPHVEQARATPPLPKQDVFPTPVPVTDQERLLRALVRRRPQQAREIADQQETDRQQIQKYLESGVPSGEPVPAQQMR